jgi:hypothetical protein
MQLYVYIASQQSFLHNAFQYGALLVAPSDLSPPPSSFGGFSATLRSCAFFYLQQGFDVATGVP